MEGLDLPVLGLVTDPGPFVAAPPGSLSKATNLAIRRAGVAEPRGQFIWSIDSGSSDIPRHIFGYGSPGTLLTVMSNKIRIGASTDATLTPSTNFDDGLTFSTTARNRALLTASNGVYVTTDASTFVRAGVPRSGNLFTIRSNAPANGKWLPTNNATAYRVVFQKMRGDTPILGAPSDIRIVRNNLGASDGVRCLIYIPELVAGDVVQLYRAPMVTPYTATPSDEMRLRATFVVSAANVAAGLIDFQDYLADTAWSGAALYTNATQQGILQANYRPYYARDVGYYNNMAFYAGHTSPQRVSTELTAIGSTFASSADNSQTLASGQLTVAAFIAGATVLTSTGLDVGLLSVGMVTTRNTNVSPGSSADAWFAADTRITAINTATQQITLSAATIGAGGGGGGSVFCWDWVGVDDGSTLRRIFASPEGITPTTVGLPWNAVFAMTDFTAATMLTGGAPDMEATWARAYGTTDFRLYANETGQGAYAAINIVFERISLTGSSFTVKSTKPLAWTSYIDSVTGITSVQDGGPNRLAFSKVLEPEAVPILNYQDIGSNFNVIQRVIRFQDSLMVFCTEGLYRITGVDPENVGIEPFDLTCRLIDTRFLAQGFGSLWAFTTRGIMKVDYGGVSPIDTSIFRSLDEAVNMNAATFTNPWATSSNENGWIAFGYTGSAGSDPVLPAGGFAAWVYHVKTQAWTRWSGRRKVSAAALFPVFTDILRPAVGFQGGVGFFYWTDATVAATSGPPFPVSADLLGDGADIASVDVDGITLTLNPSNWTPQIGDAVAFNNQLYYVISIPGAGQVRVDRGGVSAGVYPALEMFPAEIEWIGIGDGDPTQDKLYGDVRYPFDRWKFGYEVIFKDSSYDDSFSVVGNSVGEHTSIDLTDQSGTVIRSYTYYQTHQQPMQFRRYLQHASRTWGVRLGFRIEYPTFFSTAGMGRTFRAAGTRTARR